MDCDYHALCYNATANNNVISMSDDSLLSKLGPKNAYWFGLGTGLAAFFVVGFFVMLGIYLNGGASFGKIAQAGDPNIAVNPPPSAAAEPNVSLSDDDWVRGAKDAGISIVEYSDFDCPFCQRHHETMNQIMKEYDGKVNWIYRHFPLTSLHPNASKKANAAECAGAIGGQDAFWKYSDEIFARDEGGTTSELVDIAAQIGVNRSKFETCLNKEEYSSVVNGDAQDAVTQGGNGTPYNVIVAGDQQIPVNGAVPFEQFKSILDSLL